MRMFGLLGKTLKHSFSKAYFTKKFSEEKIEDCSYENFELGEISGLTGLLEAYPSLEGLNVTIPYKEEVIPFLHWENEIVRKIKACNCIKVRDGKPHGYNTDVIGFSQSLQKFLQPHHKKALILGTGGAAKAVEYALSDLNISYQCVSRGTKEGVIPYSAITKEVLEEYTLIVNTSPVGMYPNISEAPDLPYQYITKEHFLYDLIYNPEQTVFLARGAERGAKLMNGGEMLLLQAEESWRIWNS